MTAPVAPGILAEHFALLSAKERAAWREALLPKSMAEKIAALSPTARAEWQAQLTDEQLAWIPWEWRFWAQPDQRPPAGEWYGWLNIAGRGRGKTRTGAEQVREWAEAARDRGKPSTFLLVGQTVADYRDVMVNGESGLIAISPPSWRPVYEAGRRRVVWPDGSQGLLFSGDRPDQLRGPQGAKAWVDELAKFKYPDETWENLELALRLGDAVQVVVTTTPRPIPIIRALLKDPMFQISRGNSLENLRNLSPTYIRRVILKHLGTRKGRQEVFGEVLTDTPGALWTLERIERNRLPKGSVTPEMTRVVIGVDPAASAHEDSDETGIVACGRGTNGQGYLLEDRSGVYSPAQWARQACELYDKWKADLIVGEANNGGDMVIHTIKTHDQSVHVRKVFATRGKGRRAEPIASLDEQGKIHHVGMFAELEDELVLLTADEYLGAGSPSRADAYAWAFFYLLVKGTQTYDPDDYRTVKR